MSNVLFANDAIATLASSISNSQTTITLTSGEGALFPSPSTNQFFPLTLQSASSSTTYEIVYCTSRSSDTLTVVRAREGTSGTAFTAGDLAQNRPTRDTLELLGVAFAVDSGTANAMVVSIAPTFPALANMVGVPFLVQKSGSGNTGNVTIAVDGLAATAVLMPNGSQVPAAVWPANTIGWLAYNGAAFVLLNQPNGGFCPSSLSASGWKYYLDSNSPSGFFIEQWGQATFNGSFISFPIPFPNAILTITACVLGTAGYNGDTVQYLNLSNLSGFTGYGGNPVAGAGSVLATWNAKGY